MLSGWSVGLQARAETEGYCHGIDGSIRDVDDMNFRFLGAELPTQTKLLLLFDCTWDERISREGEFGAYPESMVYLSAGHCLGGQFFLDAGSFTLQQRKGGDGAQDQSKLLRGSFPAFGGLRIACAAKQERPTQLWNSQYPVLTSHGALTAETQCGVMIVTGEGETIEIPSGLPLSGRAVCIYFLLAGSTNPMQSRVDNGVLEVPYTDGTVSRLVLRNSDNWVPIEQDYYLDGYAFYTDQPGPARVHLREGALPTEPDYINTKGSCKTGIEGGAATVLDLPLDPDKEPAFLSLPTLTYNTSQDCWPPPLSDPDGNQYFIFRYVA